MVTADGEMDKCAAADDADVEDETLLDAAMALISRLIEDKTVVTDAQGHNHLIIRPCVVAVTLAHTVCGALSGWRVDRWVSAIHEASNMTARERRDDAVCRLLGRVHRAAKGCSIRLPEGESMHFPRTAGPLGRASTTTLLHHFTHDTPTATPIAASITEGIQRLATATLSQMPSMRPSPSELLGAYVRPLLAQVEALQAALGQIGERRLPPAVDRPPNPLSAKQEGEAETPARCPEPLSSEAAVGDQRAQVEQTPLWRGQRIALNEVEFAVQEADSRAILHDPPSRRAAEGDERLSVDLHTPHSYAPRSDAGDPSPAALPQANLTPHIDLQTNNSYDPLSDDDSPAATLMMHSDKPGGDT
ncbi:unnamed protein product [Vitrella brassicaformis CCMP3155]|uniref:Uncharacterized protein n=1 Tax=Vitrella brassicaformis (strain CCMP3155) TaxID=1169540 RepID=A0A0G4F9U2_VITBC|nr:unnamed protein product [Vitrella brassicaformis CCMP3155]|eukprot:CEM09717.1 unnamed protein product [Vitrella brassicaformis CCMP3155]